MKLTPRALAAAINTAALAAGVQNVHAEADEAAPVNERSVIVRHGAAPVAMQRIRAGGILTNAFDGEARGVSHWTFVASDTCLCDAIARPILMCVERAIAASTGEIAAAIEAATSEENVKAS